MNSFDQFFDNVIVPKSWAKNWLFFAIPCPDCTDQQKSEFWHAVRFYVREIHREATLEFALKNTDHLPDWIDDWAENDSNWRKTYKAIKELK